MSFFTSKHICINVDDQNEDKQLHREILVGYLHFCSALNMVFYLWSNLLWSMCSDRNAPWDLEGSDAENIVGWVFWVCFYFRHTKSLSKNIQGPLYFWLLKIILSRLQKCDFCLSGIGYCASNSSCIFSLFLSSIMLPSLFSVVFFFLLLSPLPKLLSMCYDNAARLSTHEVPAFIGGWYE